MSLLHVVAGLFGFVLLLLVVIGADFLLGTIQYRKAFLEGTKIHSPEMVSRNGQWFHAYRVKHLLLEVDLSTYNWVLVSDKTPVPISTGETGSRGIAALNEQLRKDAWPDRMIRLSSRWRATR